MARERLSTLAVVQACCSPHNSGGHVRRIITLAHILMISAVTY